MANSPPSDAVPTTASATPVAVPDAVAGVVAVSRTGTLVALPDNEGKPWCVGIDTPAGAWVLSSATDEWAVILTTGAGDVDRAKSGIHRKGRPAGEMVRKLGDQVTVRGTIQPFHDFNCSRYYALGMTTVR